ncbi:OmpA family protein [Aureispira anguillae]|uniref:OmpA family protein n=1 Tax=Aureispira anguillae TaxID=2864201 RepID=A0A916DVF3_9BACT|nr:OmpA family protein [Aureispira anguillae]BDS15084.1 OmpA family protein [Aureispira anguillae]
MRFLNYILTLFIVLVFCAVADAQRPKLNRAERLMGQHNYTAAINLYLSILEKGNDDDAMIGIAECYRRIGNPDETEYWYGLVSRMPNAPQKSWLYYAQALQRNGKYNEAKTWAEKYVSQIEPNNTQAMWLIKSCEEDVVQDLRASGKLYKVTPVDEINTENDEFAPAYFKNDLVFISARDRKAHIKQFNRWSNEADKPFTEVYTTKRNQIGEPEEYIYNYGKVEKFSPSLSSKYHDGPLTFNAEFNEIYFTRSNMDKPDDGIVRLKVYQSKGAPKKYSEPRSLPFNSDEYSVLHPSLSDDGEMLFFSSDMPGGFGGYDLYVSYLEDGRWSPPVNLGPTVNTEGNEVFPFHHESGTLYFASNGLVGMGGLDIYKTRENYGAWTDPINLGYPINTVDDDFGFIINPEQTHGYFSSSRKGKGGDDIYTFTKLSVTVEISVFDEDTQMPLEAADVFTPCSEVQNFLTNQDGKVIMELPLNKACDFAAEKLGYQPNSVRLSSKNQPPGKTLYVQIPLKLECIFIVSGTIVDGLTNSPVDSALVRLQSYCGGEQDELSMYTDAEGKYEFRDVREDCDIRVTVSKPGFTKGSVTFKTGTECGESAVAKGVIDTAGAIVKSIPLYCFGENCEKVDGELDPNDPNYDPNNPYGVPEDECIKDSIAMDNGDIKVVFCDDSYKIDRSGGGTDYYTANDEKDDDRSIATGLAQLVNIYYDYDRANLRSDAKKELKKLVAFLDAYPAAKIKLTSHTDARGKRGYNKRLSKRRAESVVRYLMENGIDKSRLRAKGMGEEVMINDCYDGIECSEEQHQENRRTEFTVIEYIPPTIKDAKSKRPTTIKTNPCNNCPGASDVEGEAGDINSIESSIEG